MKTLAEIKRMYRRAEISKEQAYINSLFEDVDRPLNTLTDDALLTYKKILTDDLLRIRDVNVEYFQILDIDHNLEFNLLEDYVFIVSKLEDVTNVLKERGIM